ncbi:MAG: hypothetical protein HY931_03650 [Candidatus Falkowbacteria bacterium]|nr:MAG: hypothetical protein HY931_03650 [Candidatus Falkowbacteria bacterium]
MKNLVIVALLVVATIGQVFGQATREQIAIADREISKAEVSFKKAEKSFDSQKAKKIAELKRDYRKQEIAGNRSENKTEIDAALKATKKLQSQIDSVNALTANADMYAKKAELKKWQDKKAELLAQFLEVKDSKKTLANADTTKSAKSDPVALNIKKKSAKADDSSDEETAAKPAKEPKEKADIYDRKIPTEVNRIDYKQRDRSYDLRRDDLVLTKIEQNINSAISPGGQEGGYKVIFDNMYIEPVDFKVFRSNGEQYTSVMVKPGVKRTKYLLPGVYFVHFYVAGKPSGLPCKLTIDGKTYDYDGESCFNFAYMPRFGR